MAEFSRHRRAELRELDGVATKGPWLADPNIGEPRVFDGRGLMIAQAMESHLPLEEACANALLIAAYREAVPDLLDALEAAEARSVDTGAG